MQSQSANRLDRLELARLESRRLLFGNSERPLHHGHVDPAAKLEPGLRNGTDAGEALRGVEGDRRRVVAADAGDQAMAAGGLTLGNQSLEQLAANAVAGAVGMHVDGVFDCISVALARAKVRGIAITDDFAVQLCDQIRKAASE